MHPPVFGISKSTPAGGLTIGGHHVPANTMVIVSVHEQISWSRGALSNVTSIIIMI